MLLDRMGLSPADLMATARARSLRDSARAARTCR